jgi:uncharacterized HAD superfamily protein
MPIHVYVDIDDVLAETTRALAHLARERFGKTVDFEDMRVFDLEVSLGLAPDELEAFMDAAHSTDFLMDLVAMEGAVETLSDWHASGIEISIVTGRPPESRSVTRRWLSREALLHHRLEVVDKYDRYAERATLRKESLRDRGYQVVVEDSPDMADYLALHGAEVLLFDRPWNRAHPCAHPGVRRVHDWTEIRGHVRSRIPSPEG